MNAQRFFDCINNKEKMNIYIMNTAPESPSASIKRYEYKKYLSSLNKNLTIYDNQNRPKKLQISNNYHNMAMQIVNMSDTIIVINEDCYIDQFTLSILIEAYKMDKIILYTNYDTSEGSYYFSNKKFPLYAISKEEDEGNG